MELLVAAKQGSLGVVSAIVSHPSWNLLARDEEGNTALHIAASRGHHDVVLELASRCTAPSGEVYAGVNNKGQTPLHLACSNGWIKCVDHLINQLHFDFNIKDVNGNTPLKSASIARHNEIILLLLQKCKVCIGIETKEESDLNPENICITGGSSCLLAAAKQGSLGVVRALVSHPSCDLLATDEEGNTALHIAASRGHQDVVLELASRYITPSDEACAGVNNEGQTPLHLACYKGWIKCVDPLAIKFPKEINVRDNNGNTPVMAASLAGHKTLVSLLKERYKVAIDSKEGELPNHKEDKHKPKPSDRTEASSCLLAAAKQGSLGVVRALVSHPSCDLLARDEEGNTALHIAASRGHHDVMLELANRYTAPSGAGVNNKGQTPLHLACHNGWIDCTRTLATMFPGDLNVKYEYDNLPLHDAALFGHGNVVDCLCKGLVGM